MSTDPPLAGNGTGWTLGVADRDQRAGRVFAILLDGLLVEFRRREGPVRRDDDVDALRRYRVALRRTRSLLHAGAGVFPVEELELLEAMASQLSAATSSVRDLDVVLSDLHDRCDRAPEILRPAESQLCDQLEARRTRARAALDDLLEGDFHDVLLRRWQRLGNVHRIGGGEPGVDAACETQTVCVF